MPSQKILVVEDSLSQRMMISRHLRNWENEVLEAADGVEAFTAFRQQSPAIIITDLDMPEMNGFQLIEEIRRKEIARTYIIVLSASDDKSSVVSALALGADDYLVKPYHPDELRVRLTGAERVLRLQNQELLIFAMAQMVDTRSPETGAHLDRVQHFSRRIAEELAAEGDPLVTASWIAQLFSLSPLHDIGKIGIPDAILNKPGRLTPEEFVIMKEHVTIGASIFSRIYERTRYAPFGFAIDIIRCHHEKWDGSGYPDGLAGENIPLCGRIVALADVYDAISSKRVYKPSFPREQCWDIINRGSGSHFDPRLVDIFNRNEDYFWNIVEELRDIDD
jgi:putative two-component system response regulator